jgi:hypothetical protein
MKAVANMRYLRQLLQSGKGNAVFFCDICDCFATGLRHLLRHKSKRVNTIFTVLSTNLLLLIPLVSQERIPICSNIVFGKKIALFTYIGLATRTCDTCCSPNNKLVLLKKGTFRTFCLAGEGTRGVYPVSSPLSDPP